MTAKPRMLTVLMDHLDEIEQQNEWEAKFIESLSIQCEETPDKTLSDRQFQKLLDVYNKWCPRFRGSRGSNYANR